MATAAVSQFERSNVRAAIFAPCIFMDYNDSGSMSGDEPCSFSFCCCAEQTRIEFEDGITRMRSLLRSKIHKAIVTEANLAYIGSITIDSTLMKLVGLWPGERVLVVSNTSGARLETYTIAGEPDSGVITMNGAAAHLIKTGDEIIIMGFELTDQPITPTMILVDKHNRFVQYL
jgi:aspartate 1-decarboxylase